MRLTVLAGVLILLQLPSQVYAEEKPISDMSTDEFRAMVVAARKEREEIKRREEWDQRWVPVLKTTLDNLIEKEKKKGEFVVFVPLICNSEMECRNVTTQDQNSDASMWWGGDMGLRPVPFGATIPGDMMISPGVAFNFMSGGF